MHEGVTVFQVCWAEVDHALQLSVYPFGQVAEGAVDAADYRSSLPRCFMDLWDGVKLRESTLQLEDPSEVHSFMVGKELPVLVEQ